MDGSGFDQDPQFEIIYMPDNEEKEQDGDKAPRSTETSAEMGSVSDSGSRDRKLDSDSTSA